MNELRDGVIVMLLVGLLTTYQMVGLLASRTYQLTEDTRAIQLVADCELWDIVPPLQPTRTVVLACPHTDGIRLWPLPAEQPWFKEQLVRRN
jgi:hypothetical protein